MSTKLKRSRQSSVLRSVLLVVALTISLLNSAWASAQQRSIIAPIALLLLDDSDSCTVQTTLVKGTNEQRFNNPGYLTDVNGTLFFTSNHDAAGLEVWKSDGTPNGTVRVTDINLGTGNSLASHLTNVDGTLFFAAKDGSVANAHGLELWKTDGTPNGTMMVKDINPGVADSNPKNLSNVNGKLFFSADNGVTGDEPWVSDGTPEGTLLLKEINVSPSQGFPSFPVGQTDVNGTLFFSATDGGAMYGNELWKSDGTPNGTVLVRDINQGFSDSGADNLLDVNGTLFFTASGDFMGNPAGRELWRSDGSLAGTVAVKDINPGTSSSSAAHLTKVNDIVFFGAKDSNVNGQELWKSDGTLGGTVMVKNIHTNTNGNSSPQFLTNNDGTLFFQADDGSQGRELWKSDGTTDGTILVKDIVPGASSSSPTDLIATDGIVYFNAFDSANGAELWQSDGTPEGTVLAKDIRPGTGSSSPVNFTLVGDTLYFSAVTDFFGRNLWKTECQ